MKRDREVAEALAKRLEGHVEVLTKGRVRRSERDASALAIKDAASTLRTLSRQLEEARAALLRERQRTARWRDAAKLARRGWKNAINIARGHAEKSKP